MKARERQYAVLGLGVFGSSVAKSLSHFGCEVLAIDNDIKCVDRIAPFTTQAVQADITEIDQLRECGVADCDVAIVGIGSHLEESVMAIINLKELKVPYIIAKAKNRRYMQIFLKLGADKAIRPEKEAGERIAKSLLGKNIVSTFDIDGDYNVVEILAPERWTGHTLRELDIRAKFGINVLGVREWGRDKITVPPDADYTITHGDQLLLVADAHSFNKLIEMGIVN